MAPGSRQCVRRGILRPLSSFTAPDLDQEANAALSSLHFAALDVWASVVHSKAAGLGRWPRLHECLNRYYESGAAVKAPSSDALARMASETYVHGDLRPMDQPVLALLLAVEDSMSAVACPPYVRAYGLYLHPRQGRFQPARPRAFDADPLAAFLYEHQALYDPVFGNMMDSVMRRRAYSLTNGLWRRTVKEVRRRVSR